MALDEFESYFRQGGQKEIDPNFFNKETQRFEPKIQRGLPIDDDEILNGYLENYLADCIQSKEYQRGISLYEKVGGKTNIDPRRANNITEFGYWICRESNPSAAPLVYPPGTQPPAAGYLGANPPTSVPYP